MGVMEARRRILLNQPHLVSASGNPIAFNTNFPANLAECKAAFSPVQAGSGDPAPDNVRPITGWTGCTVSHSGADTSNPTTYPVTFPAVGINQWNEQWEQGALDSSTGQPTSSLVQIRSKDFIPVKAGETYYGYCGALAGQASNTMVVNYYDSNQNFVAYGGGINGTTKTIPTGVSYMKFWTGTAYGNTYLNDISINYPSTDTAYHAYDNTIYGGYVDYERGEVVATWGIVDMGTLDWTYRALTSTSYLYATLSNRKYGVSNLMCSCYKQSSISTVSQMPDLSYVGNASSSTMYVKDTSYTDADTFTEAVSGQKVCYELDTPIHYPITPAIIKSLKGANTIWSDANGDIGLKYWKH